VGVHVCVYACVCGGERVSLLEASVSLFLWDSDDLIVVRVCEREKERERVCVRVCGCV